jgi:3-hydroxyacyl-[acyl-carrier-protein] dehydratase
MNLDEIKAIIPHREPFILVDEILEMDDDRVVALKHVSAEEPYFKGHFPSEPVMPGVLIVEALAQAGAVRILSMPQFEGKIAYFGRIDKVRFKQKVVPGDTLRLEVELDQVRGIAGRAFGKAYVGDELACSAELVFVVSTKED